MLKLKGSKFNTQKHTLRKAKGVIMGRIPNKLKLSNKLKQKSIEAFLLCIEVYNKPTINYRIEASSFLLCNAWELLLKSDYIIKNGVKSIYRKNDEYSFSLEEMLNKYYNFKSPIKENLLYIIKHIRNKATHLIVREHDILYTPLLQKAILNYTDEIKRMFDISISDILPLESLALLIKKADKPNLSKLYGKSISNMFLEDENRLQDFILKNTNINEACDVVAIVQSNLAFVKNQSKADILAFYDKNNGKPLQEIVVAKDVNTSHPFAMKQVIATIKKEVGEVYTLDALHNTSLTTYNKNHNLKTNERYIKTITYGAKTIKKYSRAYIDLILNDLKNNPNLFTKTKK